MLDFNSKEIRLMQIGGSILGGITMLYHGYIEHGVTILFGINYFTVMGTILILYGIVGIIYKPNSK
jgi:hypothetical protein